jgi:hypothetical protein
MVIPDLKPFKCRELHVDGEQDDIMTALLVLSYNPQAHVFLHHGAGDQEVGRLLEQVRALLQTKFIHATIMCRADEIPTKERLQETINSQVPPLQQYLVTKKDYPTENMYPNRDKVIPACESLLKANGLSKSDRFLALMDQVEVKIEPLRETNPDIAANFDT